MTRHPFLAALAALAVTAAPSAAVAAPPPILGPPAVALCQQHRAVWLQATRSFVTVDPRTAVLSAGSSPGGQSELFTVCHEPVTNLTTLQLESNGMFVTAELGANGSAWATLRASAPVVTGGREQFVVTPTPSGLGFSLRNVASGRYVTAGRGVPGGLRYPLTASAAPPLTPLETFAW